MYRNHRLNVRLADAGYQWIEKQRLRFDVSAAEVIRAALVVASRHDDEVRAHIETVKELT